jgi:hypothetical protein
VPRIKAGVVFLKSGDMAGLQGISEDMVTAMKLYGQANRRGEVPDKISEIPSDLSVLHISHPHSPFLSSSGFFHHYSRYRHFMIPSNRSMT